MIINSFPGYEMTLIEGADGKKHICNMYRGIDVGMGGYVYANHGVYYDVALLDVASMHPTSLILLNYFGKYTSIFKEIMEARLAIKHGDYELAKTMFNGKLERYLSDEQSAEQLAYALKIALNSQYGLTSTRYDVPQRDPRNVNNIVALRGALFIKTLQDAVTDKGYLVVHCKTDSIKIADADQTIIDFCFEFAKKYGYLFEHEATFEKFCLITDADYVGKYKWSMKEKNIGKWTSTGATFSHPYVFKTLFSREPIIFKDLCETKTVKTAMYLDFNEDLADGEHDYKFVGRAGQFCPVKAGRGAGELLVLRGTKYAYVAGSKGYRWLESCVVRDFEREDDIDMEYFISMSDECFSRIAQYADPEIFCSNNPVLSDDIFPGSDDTPPIMKCGKMVCDGCENVEEDRYHSDCVKNVDNSSYILMKGEEPI
jgi:hypothetical protein